VACGCVIGAIVAMSSLDAGLRLGRDVAVRCRSASGASISTRFDVTRSDNFVETFDTPSDLKRPVAGRIPYPSDHRRPSRPANALQVYNRPHAESVWR